MARIAGVDIPRNKRVEIALTYIYGIGRPTSQKILKEAGVNPEEGRTGFAFGMGINRLVAVRYGIKDIRLFTNWDLRFLKSR